MLVQVQRTPLNPIFKPWKDHGDKSVVNGEHKTLW